MALDRLLAQEQVSRYLAVGLAGRHQLGDLSLTSAQQRHAAPDGVPARAATRDATTDSPQLPHRLGPKPLCAAGCRLGLGATQLFAGLLALTARRESTTGQQPGSRGLQSGPGRVRC